MTQQEIENILSKSYRQNLDINSNDFFFQKGQDALLKWMQLDVSDSIKTKLIELSKDYDKFKKAHIEDTEIQSIVDLLFEITSYCDLHANKKEKYNKYDDKRTLAKASVRMPDWIAGLIKYKFKNEPLNAGSVINAFNYLLDPVNNSTILSENHRYAIAKNLIKKEYDPNTFITDLKNYYSSYKINVANPSNYTDVLSVLTYEQESTWKDEVIGLMASDGTQWQDEFVLKMDGFDAGVIWNSKRPSGTNNTIKFLKNIINEEGSFPLYYSVGGFVIYKFDIIDFAESQEDLDKRQWDTKYKILHYNNKFSEYQDQKKSARIVFLTNNISKIQPIPVSEFKFYDGFDAPRQDNLSPIKKEPSIDPISFPSDLFDSKELEEYIQFTKEIINRFDLKKGDERLVFSIRDNNLNFIIGQRYCWNLYLKNSKGKFGVISKDKLTESSKKFDALVPISYYNNFSDMDSVKSHIKSIDIALEEELNRSKKSSYRKYNNIDFENYVFNSTSIFNINKSNTVSFMEPLNTILYGPPGTGKTYNSINKAISIANPGFNINKDRKLVKDEYDRLERDNRILFSTFHQSMSYEDFVEGIKPMAPKPNEPLNYEIQAGIFKIACARAAYLCYKKFNQFKGISKSNYTFDELYNAFIESIKPSIINNKYPTFKTITGKDVEIYEINTQDSIKARAKGSKVTHVAPLTQENLEKLYNKFNSVTEIENLEMVRETVQVSPRSTEFYAVFAGIKDFEKTYQPDNTILEEDVSIDVTEDIEKVKKFTAGIYNEAIKKVGKESDPVVLIIDEINRGNVSQIFGELITLIEDDKRLGKAEELEIFLPYSKLKFGVPPNLHLVGTMNTADRSVEALDTALRRRFVFEEIPPKYDLLELQYTYAGVKAYEILQTINKRIEKLLDKDHLIGHSYFILKDGENANDKLKNSFYKNIIPLLQEYFFGDFGKIGLVLGQGFFNLKNWNNKEDSFAEFDHDSYGEFESKDVYEIIDYRKDLDYEVNNVKMNFERAIQKLMKINIA